MRRLAVLSLLVPVVVFATTACDTSKPGEKTVAPLPSTVIGNVPKAQTTTVPSQYKGGNPTAGKQVFETAGCKGCHTLKDAGATGTVGPNLDQVSPPLSLVVHQVADGGAVMPAFKGRLSTKQIADVAAYVVHATGGNPNG